MIRRERPCFLTDAPLFKRVWEGNADLAKYIFKRLLLLIPVLLGVSFIIFAIMALTPGDPAVMVLGEGAPKEALEKQRELMGLNEPFIVRYLRYLWDALHGDFGRSYRTNIPVFGEIMTRLPYTVTLASLTILVAAIIGVPLGVLSAVKQYSIMDTSSLAIALTVTSMPEFFLAMLLILLFSIKLGWLPMIGMESWKHLILPVVSNSMATLASLMRMTRTTMLEVIRQDYIRTARAKGASQNTVIYGHALQNALLPVITVIGTNFGFALGGSIVTEQMFTIPGLGTLMINSIRAKDTPMVMAAVLTTAVFASLINLIVDVLYSYVDPRLSSQFVAAKKKKVKET